MSESTKKINLSFRVTPEFQEELKIAAARRHTKIQPMIEEALAILLGDSSQGNPSVKKAVTKPPDSGYNEVDPSMHKWIDALVRVLQSGHSDAMRAVLSNLVAFDRLAAIDKETHAHIAAHTEIQDDITGAISELRRVEKRARAGGRDHKERSREAS